MHLLASQALFEAAVKELPPEIEESRGWIIHQRAYPVLDIEFRQKGRTPLRIRTEWVDWDDQPPSVTLLEADGTPLKTFNPNPSGIFNYGQHPSTGKPFICMAGTREYHTHNSHLDTPWSQYRGKPGFDLGGIITQIWHGWLKGSN